MLPNVVFRFPFLSWLITSFLIYSGMFWSYYVGFLSHIIESDFTKIATGLILLFVYLNLSLGKMAWNLQKFIDSKYDLTLEDTSYFFTNYDVITFFAVLAPSIGFVGTVIGLSSLMKEAGGVTLENLSVMIGSGTGAALFPTLIGLIGYLIIRFQKFLQTHSFRIFGFAAEI